MKEFVPSTHTSDRDCVAWLESNSAAVEDLVHSTRKEFTAAAVTKLLKVSQNNIVYYLPDMTSYIIQLCKIECAILLASISYSPVSEDTIPSSTSLPSSLFLILSLLSPFSILSELVIRRHREDPKRCRLHGGEEVIAMLIERSRVKEKARIGSVGLNVMECRIIVTRTELSWIVPYYVALTTRAL